jgi:hypothetical protein
VIRRTTLPNTTRTFIVPIIGRTSSTRKNGEAMFPGHMLIKVNIDYWFRTLTAVKFQDEMSRNMEDGLYFPVSFNTIWNVKFLPRLAIPADTIRMSGITPTWM